MVNHNRVHRLRREEGLQRLTSRKPKRVRSADRSDRRQQAERVHHVWAMDFQVEATTDVRRLQFLNLIDEPPLPAHPGGTTLARQRTW